MNELMVMTYEAVPSAVTVPPWRPDPKPPIYAIRVSGFFQKHQPNPLIFSRNLHVDTSGKQTGGDAGQPILRNGSAWVCRSTQVLQLELHREHALQLPIEMDLVASKTFEPVRIYSFAKCLCAD